MVLCLMIIEKIDLRFERISFCKSLGAIAENVLPIIGNACFLPIIYLILDVFICDEAHGE
jgi:hypothetical protein